MHGNFIVNAGNAKAEEVLQLIEHVKKTIYELHTSKNGNRGRNNRSKVTVNNPLNFHITVL